MRTAIFLSLLVIIGLLLAALYMLLQFGPSYQANGPSLGAGEAAVGRAVLTAGQSDPSVAAAVRASVQSAPEEDRALAADLIVKLPKR